MTTNSFPLPSTLASVALLLAFVNDVLDHVIDARLETTWEDAHRTGVPNAVASLELLAELGDRADATTARCMLVAAHRRVTSVARVVGLNAPAL
jgi:hypothetical protein